MADEPDSLVLRHLRRLDEKLDRLIDDVHDAKVRLTAIEEGMAGINRRIDRVETRLDRIEKRLELADAH
jgi:predicted  nucleic acid-binding Zn-ribbon protein